MKALRNVALGLFLVFVLTVFPAMAEAYTWTDVARGESTTYVGNSCVGELVVVDSRWYYVMQLTVDGSGGYHFDTVRYVGGTGYGLSTGNRYAFHDVYQSRSDWTGYPEYPIVLTEKNAYQVIGLGGVEDMVGHLVTHVTINANGELSVYVDNSGFTCH